jgi:hypothetical protein
MELISLVLQLATSMSTLNMYMVLQDRRYRLSIKVYVHTQSPCIALQLWPLLVSPSLPW